MTERYNKRAKKKKKKGEAIYTKHIKPSEFEQIRKVGSSFDVLEKN
jgi:hypothetical protein